MEAYAEVYIPKKASSSFRISAQICIFSQYLSVYLTSLRLLVLNENSIDQHEELDSIPT